MTTSPVITTATAASGWAAGLRRLAFALRFSEPNLLLSGDITGDSRILYVRDVRERVELLAPFLEFDADPYPVLLDDRVLWVIDGYTTTDRYPYATDRHRRRAPSTVGSTRRSTTCATR